VLVCLGTTANAQPKKEMKQAVDRCREGIGHGPRDRLGSGKEDHLGGGMEEVRQGSIGRGIVTSLSQGET
jgi:hypothetical protein